MLANVGAALTGTLLFGAAGICGALLAIAILPTLHRFEDGPQPVDVHPAVLVAGAALIGAILGWRHIGSPEIVIAAFATIFLVAIWYCDARTGIVPDLFTLVPLAALLIFSFFEREPMTIVSAIVMFLPFAMLAAVSRGRGMGWGDAKLAAFGGALVGLYEAVPAFIVATFLAAAVTWLLHRQRNVPVALGPYLVAAIAVCIAVQPV